MTNHEVAARAAVALLKHAQYDVDEEDQDEREEQDGQEPRDACRNATHRGSRLGEPTRRQRRASRAHSPALGHSSHRLSLETPKPGAQEPQIGPS
jgi:hypothetical protein